MKILFLTQWFDPEPTPKGLEFVKMLITLGYEVDVLTSIPNYPLGKYYPGYKFSFIQKEIMDDVSVYRVPIYPSHDSSSIRRFFTYFTFCISSSIIACCLKTDTSATIEVHSRLPLATFPLPASAEIKSDFPLLFLPAIRKCDGALSVQSASENAGVMY